MHLSVFQKLKILDHKQRFIIVEANSEYLIRIKILHIKYYQLKKINQKIIERTQL